MTLIGYIMHSDFFGSKLCNGTALELLDVTFFPIRNFPARRGWILLQND